MLDFRNNIKKNKLSVGATIGWINKENLIYVLIECVHIYIYIYIYISCKKCKELDDFRDKAEKKNLRGNFLKTMIWFSEKILVCI